MERLTLENAINRSRKLSERHRWNSENTKLETSDENANEVYKNTCIQYANQEEQYAEWLEELKSYKDIGTPKELKELKENGILNRLELAKLAIMQKELKKYKDLEEQGLLVKLPCKVGAEAFVILPRDSHYTKCQIKKIEIRPTIFGKICYFAEPVAQRGCCFRYFDNEFGKVIFLTREDAEKKLEEMKNGKK